MTFDRRRYDPIFDSEDEDRRKAARTRGDDILFWLLVAIGCIAAAELVLRGLFGVRTLL